MECLDTTKSLKINLKRNIGTVLIIVEGSFDEFKLFKQIFNSILHYEYIEKSRNQKHFRKYDEFVMKNNKNSRVIVINTKNSNLSSIKKDRDYLNEVYMHLYADYDIDIKNINVYFVWDRDNESNPKDVTEELISKLGCSYGNKDGDMNGLLLLSYPSLESYIISSFNDRVSYLKDVKLKQYVKEENYKIVDIDKNKLLKATVFMHKVLIGLGIQNYDLDDFSNTSLKIFDKQENIFNDNGYYCLLSLISLILLDLNIITPRNAYL